VPDGSGGAHQSAAKLYLIDVSSFIYRAYYAIRNLRNKDGLPTNAVYGVATMLVRVIEEAKPAHLAVVYDSKEPSFRKKMFADYKANRSAPPDDLVPQFEWIERLVAAMGISSYRVSGSEADDIIATLACKWKEGGSGREVVIVSGDKDLMQLVGDGITLWDTMSGKHYGPSEVEEKHGVPPRRIRDYLALMGDSSDNIPGVPGIGPKTASDLIAAHGGMEEILGAAARGEIAGKKAETLTQHAAAARLSYELVTLKTDLQVEPETVAGIFKFEVKEVLLSLFGELGFKTLAAKWGGTREQESRVPDRAANAPAPQFTTINTMTALRELLQKIEQAGEFAIDLETTSLNPRCALIVGIALAYDTLGGFYIPLRHRGTQVEQLAPGEVMDALRPFIENPRYKKIGQNLKYDWSVLLENGFKPDGIGADTMVAGYVLDPEGRHNLEKLAARYLDYRVMTFEEVCGRGEGEIGFDLVDVTLATRYSAEDAWAALALWYKLREKITAEGLMEVFATVDLPMVPLLAKMECAGVGVDEEWLAGLSKKFDVEIKELDRQIQSHSSLGPLNLNSPKQLARFLFDELHLPPQGKTKTGYSTDASVLEALAHMHEVPRLLLEYREITKLKGTYVDPIPALRDPKTGRVHASFHQAVTATGRLSSSDPNLQNIPVRSERGRMIRRAFVPSKGGVLVSADYSQIELRLLAHMSRDKELVASFAERDEDVHRRTASEIFGVAVEAVSKWQRDAAKAINFGLVYGKTAFGLAHELGIGRREAQEMIDRYFARYSGVKTWLERQIAETRQKGWTLTLLGRKRFLPAINDRNHAVRTAAERMAMNTPVQGTAADLMKLAMIRIDDALERSALKARVIIQVHDEVVVDCPAEEEQAVRKLVVTEMQGAMSLSVPLKVNTSSGTNWMELK